MEKIITDYNKMGISIIIQNGELVIKGSKRDLIELADYIEKVALSNCKNDHLHLDELTLISSESNIKKLVIEKEK